MGIDPVTAPHERMTLTLPALLNAREIIVHISGEEKRKVYEKAIPEVPLEEMSVRFVLRQENVPVMVYCYEGLAGQDCGPSLIASSKENSLIEIGKHLLWQAMFSFYMF